MPHRLTSAAVLGLVLVETTFAAMAGVNRDPAADFAAKPVTVYLTAKDTGQRLTRTGELRFVDLAQPTERQQCIFVDPSKTFQTVIGIGGALTDAAAETFYKLSGEKRALILKAYYDTREGIGYSLGRTHINSCDFSSESYPYVRDDDKELNSFSIGHDLKYRVPFIKEV